mgnify:CR=1 FL=1
MKRNRVNYIAQNMNEIKKQIAVGHGGHIETLTFLSLCSEKSVAKLSEALQKNFSDFMNIKNNGNIFASKIDNIIKNGYPIGQSLTPLRIIIKYYITIYWINEDQKYN